MKIRNEELILRGVPEKLAQMRIEQAMARRTHAAHWPVHARIINYYLVRLGFLELVYKSIKKLINEGWKSEKIAELFKGPTILFYRWGLFDSKKYTQLTSDERMELADLFAEYIKILKQPPLLCENHQSQLWDNETVTKIVHEATWIELKSPEDKKMAGELFGQMFNYTELLYFAYHAHGHEFHGSYQVDNYDYLFADFFRLQSPIYEASKVFPFPEFRIGIQTINYPFNIDIYQHLFAKEPLPPHVQKIFVVGTGKVETLLDLQNLIKKINLAIEQVVFEISKKTEEEMIIKFLLSCYVGFSDLLCAAGTELEIPWTITSSELKQNYSEAPPPIPPKMAENPNAEELLEYWMKQLSPL